MKLIGKTCTVGGARKCGLPAVTSFRGSDGVTYFECAAHEVKPVAKPKAASVIRKRADGLDVPVGHRLGRDFT